MLNSDSGTVPEDAAVLGAGVDCCWPLRDVGDLDRLSIFGEPPEGGVPPGDILGDWLLAGDLLATQAESTVSKREH